MSIITAVMDLETAVLPRLDEQWSPPTEEIKKQDNEKFDNPYDIVVYLTSDFKKNNAELYQVSSHLLLSLNLASAKLIDLMLSGEANTAKDLYTMMESACIRNLSIINHNIQEVTVSYKKFARFSRNMLSEFSKEKAAYIKQLEKCKILLEDKKDEITYIKNNIKSIHGEGYISQAAAHYKIAIKHVTGLNLEPIKVSEDGEIGTILNFEIPLPKERRFDRKYKRELEEKIHDTVSQSSNKSVGQIGINWTDKKLEAA
ncbi:hypothetical protein [Acetobacter okinawensis]|uniref:Uncharacterized protein n=1 Tax=Acetobacter okinawensis TaxID=1076594 RepID=A0A252BSD2_9PROT|nr:hypothetical protein [Acetobacter okinawensis]OUJ11423.1 hypothetical protein HK26_06195 [Acetobacter okinawensis]